MAEDAGGEHLENAIDDDSSTDGLVSHFAENDERFVPTGRLKARVVSPLLLENLKSATSSPFDGILRIMRFVRQSLVRRSGQECWPKAFQNLRSSRQTELEAEFPIHTVCQWMGNSPKIAALHYLQVLESDFKRTSVLACTVLHDAQRKKPGQGKMNGTTLNSEDPNVLQCPSDSAGVRPL